MLTRTFIDIFFTELNHLQAAGRAKPSYTLHCLEQSMSPENEFIVKWTAFSLYAGGADTVRFRNEYESHLILLHKIVSAIYGFFLAMVLHPDVLKKAQKEIDDVLGDDILPTFLDRERLPYIDAVVKETLRWNSLGPLGTFSFLKPHRMLIVFSLSI